MAANKRSQRTLKRRRRLAEDPIEQVPGSGTDTLGRLEECELDETTERRIRALGEDLEQMLLRYTERHPDVVATREALEELEQAALSDCVERLQ